MRRLIPLLLLLSACKSMTGYSDEDLAEADRLCSGVNAETWNSQSWENQGMTPQEVCHSNIASILGGEVPCMFGGMPFMCTPQGDGSYFLRQGWNAVGVILYQHDLERIGDNFKVIEPVR